ncbi:hypothetical protein BJ508DRAFT_306856 [Ascobolus immersus RN42]|uniref:F-box domain-containing protein n=1 Tax=Ascobolus immersus RN42 TaxID=1160509 RepID=A0A3N4I913_ASCIM|nr:hypothetical protein BJ508DRAFT_306856 [Ascobolus immersus RN42]
MTPGLLTLPFELHLEIFLYSTLFTLLNLSHSNRYFRDAINGPRGYQVWLKQWQEDSAGNTITKPEVPLNISKPSSSNGEPEAKINPDNWKPSPPLRIAIISKLGRISYTCSPQSYTYPTQYPYKDIVCLSWTYSPSTFQDRAQIIALGVKDGNMFQYNPYRVPPHQFRRKRVFLHARRRSLHFRPTDEESWCAWKSVVAPGVEIDDSEIRLWKRLYNSPQRGQLYVLEFEAYTIATYKPIRRMNETTTIPSERWIEVFVTRRK